MPELEAEFGAPKGAAKAEEGAATAAAPSQAPKKCTSGDAKCAGADSWSLCSNDVWYTRPCPAGTQCGVKPTSNGYCV